MLNRTLLVQIAYRLSELTLFGSAFAIMFFPGMRGFGPALILRVSLLIMAIRMFADLLRSGYLLKTPRQISEAIRARRCRPVDDRARRARFLESVDRGVQLLLLWFGIVAGLAL